MTRTITAAVLTEIAKDASETIWLAQFLEAATATEGTLERVVEGKLLDVDTTALADTTDFTVIQGGTIDLGGSGGRLKLNPGGTLSTPLVVTYDSGLSDYRGVVMQIEFFRNVGADTISGFPGLAVPIPGALDYYMIQKYVAPPPSTTYPGGPYNEDSQMRHHGGLGMETPIGDVTIFSQHVQHPVIFSYGADGAGIKGYVSPGNVGRITYDEDKDPEGSGTPLDSADPFGFHVRWLDEDSPSNGYDDPVEVSHLRAYSSEYVCVFNLPPNYKATLKNGASSSHGDDIGGTTSGLDGMSVIWLDGEACPYDDIEVHDVADAANTSVTLSPADGVWGGDCFRWSPPAPTEVLAVSSGDRPHTWNSITFEGLGRDNMTVDPLRETGKLKEQNLKLQFSAVDLTVLNALKAGWYRGGTVRVWMAKVVGGAIVADPIGPFEFVSHDGPTVEERWSGGKPGKATLRIPVVSKLEALGNNPGVRTNLRSHQRWYPGDTGMQTVPLYAGKRIPWGALGAGEGWLARTKSLKAGEGR